MIKQHYNQGIMIEQSGHEYIIKRHRIAVARFLSLRDARTAVRLMGVL